MSLLDRFIEDTARQTGLGHRSKALVEVLVAYIRCQPDGLEGLRRRFDAAGLGALFPTGGVGGLPARLLGSQLERVIGIDELARLARRAGFPAGMFAVLVADLLPALVQVLEHEEQQARTAARRAHHRSAHRHAGHALRGTLWLLVVVILLGLTGWIRQKTRAPQRDAAAPATLARHPPRLSLVDSGGHIQARGQLPTESDRRILWNALVASHGKHRVDADIALDRQATPPRWLPRLAAHLAEFKADGLRLTFTGDTLNADMSALPEAQRLAISAQLRRHFAHYRINGLWDPGMIALARLPPDHSTEQLAAALNHTRVSFHPQSARLRGDSRDALRITADALRAAPPGTRLVVGAHTDSSSAPHASLALSQLRATAVVDSLHDLGVPPGMLHARGHGQDQPIADNRSEEGRQRNQRITYRVLR